MKKSEVAEVTKCGILDMQVCVPKEWTDKQVVNFANTNNPSGTHKGWFIRKQGNEALGGCDERVVCSKYPNKVHIMLEC